MQIAVSASFVTQVSRRSLLAVALTAALGTSPQNASAKAPG